MVGVAGAAREGGKVDALGAVEVVGAADVKGGVAVLGAVEVASGVCALGAVAISGAVVFDASEPPRRLVGPNTAAPRARQLGRSGDESRLDASLGGYGTSPRVTRPVLGGHECLTGGRGTSAGSSGDEGGEYGW